MLGVLVVLVRAVRFHFARLWWCFFGLSQSKYVPWWGFHAQSSLVCVIHYVAVMSTRQISFSICRHCFRSRTSNTFAPIMPNASLALCVCVCVFLVCVFVCFCVFQCGPKLPFRRIEIFFSCGFLHAAFFCIMSISLVSHWFHSEKLVPTHFHVFTLISSLCVRALCMCLVPL